MRASQAAKLVEEKPNETQAPHSRADNRKLRTGEQLLNQDQGVAVVYRVLEVSAPTYHQGLLEVCPSSPG